MVEYVHMYVCMYRDINEISNFWIIILYMLSGFLDGVTAFIPRVSTLKFLLKLCPNINLTDNEEKNKVK